MEGSNKVSSGQKKERTGRRIIPCNGEWNSALQEKEGKEPEERAKKEKKTQHIAVWRIEERGRRGIRG